MKQAIIGSFDSDEQATLALKEISFDRLANNEISILKLKEANKDDGSFKEVHGFAIQGTDFEISELGETYIAGPLADRIKNETAQNLKAALITYGVTEADAEEYQTSAQKGKTLLIIETNSKKASNVANIMSQYGAKSISKWNKNLNHGLKVYKSP